MSISCQTLNNLYNQGIINYVPYELCNVPPIATMEGNPMENYSIKGIGAYSQAPLTNSAGYGAGYGAGLGAGYNNMYPGSPIGDIDISAYKKSLGAIGGAYGQYQRGGYNGSNSVRTSVTVPNGGYYSQSGYTDSNTGYNYNNGDRFVKQNAPKQKPGFFQRLKLRRKNKLNPENNLNRQGYSEFGMYEHYDVDSPEYAPKKSKLKEFWQNNSAILRGLISVGILTFAGILFCKKVKNPKKIKKSKP